MSIINQELWQDYVEKNNNPYGGCCVTIAKKAMEILDREPGDFDPGDLIMLAEKESEQSGITGFMAGCIATMIFQCHSRGEEFRKKWNIKTQIGKEGERANETGGILNPALLNINI